MANREIASVAELRVRFDEKKIDALFAHLNQRELPGAAVGISIHGTPVYRKGFGLASMELPAMLSSSVRMRLGAASKQFTALAYMLLCEQGRAGIDDPLGSFLPRIHSTARQVTMRQLMSNTGGLRDVYNLCFHFSGAVSTVSSAELLALYEHIDDVNAPPGCTWNDNSGGWLLLSAAIEHVAGQPLAQFLWEHIFAPIGMYDTLLRPTDIDFVPGSAVPHMVNAAGGFEKSYCMEYTGAGGIVSTVDDMLRWLAHMDRPSVGSSETWALMRTPCVLPDGTSTGYGWGLLIERYRGVETLHYPGNWVGSNAEMIKVPAAGLDIVVMVNRGDQSAPLLASQIVDACLPDLEPLREPAERPIATGTFRSPRTGRIIQLFGLQNQQIASLGGTDLPVAAGPDGTLQPVGPAATFKYALTLVGDATAPQAVRLDGYGVHDELLAVGPPGPASPEGIVGVYCSAGTRTRVTVSETRKGVSLSSEGPFGSVIYDLRCIADGIWQASSRGTLIPFAGVFVFEEGGGLQFSNFMTGSLPFRRCS